MSIRRGPRPETKFYTLDKAISEDTRLSWQARGLLIFLLGKPDHWEVSVQHLIKQTQDAIGRAAGRDAVRVILKELETAGYLKADLARSEGGAFNGMAYTVSEIPDMAPETEKPAPASPETEYPAPAQPAPANPPLVKNDLQQPTEEAAKTDQEQTPNPLPGVGEMFDRFWKVYPRHVAKANARKAFEKLKPTPELLDAILVAIAAQRVSPAWLKDNGQFIPHPTTWLNGRRWEDEIQAAPMSRSSGFSERNYTNGIKEAGNGDLTF